MFLNDEEFKAWACKTYDISEQRLTELMKEGSWTSTPRSCRLRRS